GALWALSVRDLCRFKRLLVLTLLYALPVGIVLLFRLVVVPRMSEREDLAQQFTEVEFGLVFWMIPNALVSLTALVFGSGMIQDEQEDQTLTYLLVRPLPRWAVYVTKLLAVVFIAGLFTAAFTALT